MSVLAWLPRWGKAKDKREQGELAEDMAAHYLIERGLTLATRNFRCKGGEIDLVMYEGPTLVFVEVRQRSSADFGGAAASITPAKRRRLWIAAEIYLQQFRMPPPTRFDVVAIDGDQLEWLRNALEF